MTSEMEELKIEKSSEGGISVTRWRAYIFQSLAIYDNKN